MKHPLFLRNAIAITFLVFSASQNLHAQIKDNGPTSLVITYKAAPAKRAALRSYMEAKGAGQFEKWKKDGIFQSYLVLFGPYAADGAPDMTVILDFASFAYSGRWKEIEKRMPGGLPAEALALGAPVDSVLAYPLSHGESVVRDPAKSAYVLGPYQVTVDMPKYENYARGYIVPQFKGWIADGALSSYAIYIRQPYQDPSSTVWTSLLVLEYKDMEALARSDIVKDSVRKQLAKDPAWKALSDNKQEMRKAHGFIFADPIVPKTR